MSDTPIEVKPGHQHNFKRGPAGAGGTYIRDTPTDLKPGETVILRSGAEPPPPPPPPPPPDPDPDPDPGPPPPTGTGPSGIPLPTTPAPGWKFAGRTGFDDNIALGSWSGDRQGVLQPRPDKARDGQDRDSSGRAKYDAKRTISQEGSLLICRMLQDASGQRYAGSPVTVLPDVPSVRVTQCMKVAGPVEGWKIAPLVAVMGGNVSIRGEYDLPEGILSLAPYVNAVLHKVGGVQAIKRISEITGHRGEFYRWHTWTTEVISGKSAQHEMDGKVILRITDGVTKENVKWRLQHETRLAGQAIPAKMDEARVLIDWVTVEVPA